MSRVLLDALDTQHGRSADEGVSRAVNESAVRPPGRTEVEILFFHVSDSQVHRIVGGIPERMSPALLGAEPLTDEDRRIPHTCGSASPGRGGWAGWCRRPVSGLR